MAARPATKPRFFATGAAFRAWLEKHHARADVLLVGFHRKASGRGGLTYPEALDAALCFGWIDGLRKGIDDSTYTIRFSPRRPGKRFETFHHRLTVRAARRGGPRLRDVDRHLIELHDIHRHVGPRRRAAYPRQLGDIAIDDEALRDVDHGLRRLVRRQPIEDVLQPDDRVARPLLDVHRERVRLVEQLLTANLALAGGRRAGALAVEHLTERRRIVAIDRERFGEAHAPAAAVRLRLADDALEQHLYERVVGGEIDLRSRARYRRDGDAVGAVERADESARRVERDLPASGSDVAGVDCDHDQPSADRRRIRAVVLGRRRRRFGGARKRDEFG